MTSTINATASAMTASETYSATWRQIAVECREDDERLPRAPFTSRHDDVKSAPPGYKLGSAQVRCDAATDQVPSGCLIPFFVLHHSTADVIARTRNNLPAIARALEAAAEMADEVEAVKHILDAGFSGETLRQAAERVELACAERNRERDAARAEADQLRARVAALESGLAEALQHYPDGTMYRLIRRNELRDLLESASRVTPGPSATPADLHVTDGATGIRTSELEGPARVDRVTVSVPGSVGIDLDD